MEVNAPLAVNISNLGFQYRDTDGVVFSGLNLQIKKGERFGLFGPNGAGKTTLLNLATGLLSPAEGRVQLLGLDVHKDHRAVNKLLGFVPQDFSFYEELSPVENMQFFGAWAGLSKQQIKHKTDELLHILGLENVRDKHVGKFSGGMMRRVNLAIGVIHDPAILILDEPTVGVDVQTRHAIVDYLLQLNRKGTTLIYTSHQLSEAEDLCHVAALIDDGQIIAQGLIETLLEEHKQDDLEHLFLDLTGKEFRNNV
ncbi:MAG TPA: ABC transporter ATP-binding protein [Mucilaginibacter sp.]|jgi:ABC-2 type transport system ATP-binding protein|nr:ABC transporter ATP-binding protein [Mucilaginibacter sp.]